MLNPFPYTGIHGYVDAGDVGNLVAYDNLQAHLSDRQRGVTPLFLATTNHNMNMMQFLLAQGADPNEAYRTPLFMAVLYADDDMVNMLLSAGANPNGLSGTSATRLVAPLHVAATKGLVEITKILLRSGADFSDYYGTPAHVAAYMGHQYIMGELLVYQPDLSILLNGDTVFHVAFGSEDSQVAKVLTNSQEIDWKMRNLCMMLQDSDGNTIAHLVAMQRREAKLKSLIGSFPQLLTTRNNDGWSPLFYISAPLREAVRQAFISRAERNLELILTRKLFSDVTLQCHVPETNSWVNLEAHKAILWARCPFLHPFLSTDASTIDIPSTIQPEDLKALLQYFYTDQLPKLDADIHRNLIETCKLMCPENTHLLSQANMRLGIALTINAQSQYEKDINILYNNPLFSDVQLTIVDGNDTHLQTTLNAHKCVLCTSEYFETMFTSGLAETHTSEAAVRGNSHDAWVETVKWLYLQPYKVKSVDLNLSILQVASLALLPSLNFVAQVATISKIAHNNIMKCIKSSITYDASMLYEETINYLALNPEVMASSPFKVLAKDIQSKVLADVKSRTQSGSA